MNCCVGEAPQPQHPWGQQVLGVLKTLARISGFMSWEEDTEVQTVHWGGAVEDSKHSSGKTREAVTQGSLRELMLLEVIAFSRCWGGCCNGRAGLIHLGGGFSHLIQLLIKAESTPVASAGQQGSWSHHPTQVQTDLFQNTKEFSYMWSDSASSGAPVLGLTLSWSRCRSSVWGCDWVCEHVSFSEEKVVKLCVFPWSHCCSQLTVEGSREGSLEIRVTEQGRDGHWGCPADSAPGAPGDGNRDSAALGMYSRGVSVQLAIPIFSLSWRNLLIAGHCTGSSGMEGFCCFQLSFTVSTWALCAPVGRGGCVYPGAGASRGTELFVCPSEAFGARWACCSSFVQTGGFAAILG
ncbi:hypothetical protein EK904_002394 [Melospiza melodia maxima]|nr:hypothetical protein EK904_002394 [Melospiza melodia maxima]